MRFNKVVQAIGVRATLEQNNFYPFFGQRWNLRVFVEHPYIGSFGMRGDYFPQKNNQLFFFLKPPNCINVKEGSHGHAQNLTLVGRNFFMV
jgi:hypothetical protein